MLHSLPFLYLLYIYPATEHRHLFVSQRITFKKINELFFPGFTLILPKGVLNDIKKPPRTVGNGDVSRQFVSLPDMKRM